MHKLPKPYRLGEEIANAITHGLGTFLAIAALTILVARAAIYAPSGERVYYITSFCIFGFSMIFLYLMSTLYHSLLKTRAYPVFERLDHSAIYVLIAGTYTAYCLTALRSSVGWWIFGLIWGLAAVGIRDLAEIPRMPVVVDDDVAVEILEIHQPSISRAVCSAPTRRSISARVL